MTEFDTYQGASTISRKTLIENALKCQCLNWMLSPYVQMGLSITTVVSLSHNSASPWPGSVAFTFLEQPFIIPQPTAAIVCNADQRWTQPLLLVLLGIHTTK
jgi:hypothetical protein